MSFFFSFASSCRLTRCVHCFLDIRFTSNVVDFRTGRLFLKLFKLLFECCSNGTDGAVVFLFFNSVYSPGCTIGILKLLGSSFVFSIGMSHKSSERLRVPRRITSLSLMTESLFFVNTIWHPSLQSGPIAIKDELRRFGKIYPCCAFFESFDDNDSCPVPVVCNGVESGWWTDGPRADLIFVSINVSSGRI